MYQAVEHGKFINRGFLNGPYCPIYGFGVIIVASVLEPIKNDIIILYIGSVVLTSCLELVTGFLLEKIFHMHWWDYSGERLNLHGYICLKFSLLWGVACLIVVRLVHPTITVFVDKLPHTVGLIFIAFFMTGFASDMIITVLAIIHYKKRILLLEDISAEMRRISDKTGEKIFNKVEDVMDKKEEFDEKSAELRQKYDELREKYKVYISRHSFNIDRIKKAFPKLDFERELSFKEHFNELKRSLSDKYDK